MENWNKYLAEAIASFALVFVAAGAVLANAQTGGSLQTLGIALATGLTLAAVMYGAMHISGAHVNPAITISLWATGHTKLMQAIGYVISQLIGAVVAALFLKVIFGGVVSPQYFLGDTTLLAGVTPGMGILVEAILTFFLVWTFFATVVDKKATPGFGALAVGFVLAVGIMFAGGITMGALNPARSFGPALITSHWAGHYVYWVGPIVGGIVAGFVYHFGILKKHLG